jgi:ankyrin repeat protein
VSDQLPPQDTAQPQRPAAAVIGASTIDSGRRASGSGPSNVNPQDANDPPQNHSADNGVAASDGSSRRDSHNFSLRRWSSYASSAFSLGSLPIYPGVTVDHETTGGKKTWIIRATRLGAWIIGFHLLFAAAGIINFIAAIVAWVGSSSDNKTMQSILQSVTDTGSRFQGMEEQLQRWFEETKARSAAEAARAKDEQRLWDALIKGFESCATFTGRENETNACTELKQFFDNHPLPRPDRSPVAKRNLAKLDVVIRRDHLDIKAGGTGTGLWTGNRLLYILAALAILCAGTLTVFFCYLMLRKWTPIVKRRIKLARKNRYYGGSEKENTEEERPTFSTVQYATGGEISKTKQNVVYRGHRLASAHALAARGARDELIKLQSNGQLNVNQIDDEYGSLLAAAARSGDLATINYILSRKPDLNAEGGRYYNALQAAAHSGSQDAFDKLLAAGVREQSIGGFYGTVVNAAAEKGSPQMLRTVLRALSDVSSVTLSTDREAGTYGYPLIAAAARGSLTSVEALIEHGAPVDRADSAGTIALHQAATNGHTEIVKLLIRSNSPLNRKSTAFGTPLHAACRGKQPQAAQVILDSGADPSIKDEQRLRTPLHEAANTKEGLEQILRRILEIRPDIVDDRDVDGQTALHLASISGNISAVRTLLVFQAGCGIGDKFNAQPLFRAAGCGHPDIVWELLDRGNADPNAADCFGRTALHGPAQTTDVRVHEYLIRKGANVNVVGNDMKTPLHEACNMGRIENVRLLLDRLDIKINELDNDQLPPLYKSLCSCDAHKDYFEKCVDSDIPKMLLERNDIDVNASNGIALQEAAKKGYIDFVKIMLSKGGNVQMQGGKFGGVLQAAAISGSLGLVNLLLKPEYRADINQVGGEFGTPLAAAAAFGHVEVVRRLLEAGANPCLNGVGKYGSPWQSTCRMVDPSQRFKWTSTSIAIHDLLEQYGGKDAEEKSDMPYENWRWKLVPTGWSWIPPGEM